MVNQAPSLQPHRLFQREGFLSCVVSNDLGRRCLDLLRRMMLSSDQCMNAQAQHGTSGWGWRVGALKQILLKYFLNGSSRSSNICVWAQTRDFNTVLIPSTLQHPSFGQIVWSSGGHMRLAPIRPSAIFPKFKSDLRLCVLCIFHREKSESEDTQVKDVEYSNLKPWTNGELWSARS